MFPVMKFASKLNGFLFCFMLIAMFLYSMPAVFQFATSQKEDETFGWFEDGKALRKFEKFYDKRFFLREPSAQMWANLRYRLFGEGTSGVLIGRDGWLFTNQEYLVPGNWRDSMAGQAQQIAEIQSRLREHNKRLVLLPVPMKVDIYSEYARRPADQRALSVYDDFVGQLAASGVDTVSLREAFVAARADTELFVVNDTHWSPAGARLAAQTLARTYPQLAGATDYQSQQLGEKEHHGDLVNYLQFDSALAPQLFVPARLPVYETLKAQRADTADDLFGDQSIALALVGTSYSKFDDWNFVGFLKEALHSDLVDFSQEAYGPFQAMEIFLADNKALADPDIQTVIWEFPVRTVLAQSYLLKAAKSNPEKHL